MHFRSREKFTSRVTLDRPGSIDVEYIEGPMKYLHNDWRFRPDGQGGSIVDFNVEFAFRTRMLATLAGRFFDEALRQLVQAFEARANKLYAAGWGADRTRGLAGKRGYVR